jgi:hypothetical protein
MVITGIELERASIIERIEILQPFTGTFFAIFPNLAMKNSGQ